jgi:hypothetical protein
MKFSHARFAWILPTLIVLGGLLVFAISAVQANDPPPASRCADENFLPVSNLRTSVPDEFKDYIHCRVIAQNGSFTRWNNRALYHRGTIGHEGMLAEGVIGAVDVFSPHGMRAFNDVVVCMRGSGRMFLLNDTFSDSARTPVETTAWTTDAFPGFTCATLYQPALLLLVRPDVTPTPEPTLDPAQELDRAQNAANSAAGLAGCQVEVLYTLRLRALPTTESETLARIPHTRVLESSARAGVWFRVQHGEQAGWVHSDYVREHGSCG